MLDAWHKLEQQLPACLSEPHRQCVRDAFYLGALLVVTHLQSASSEEPDAEARLDGVLNEVYDFQQVMQKAVEIERARRAIQ
jgi:hypothetical protein